jgi:hypothetical protein
MAAACRLPWQPLKPNLQRLSPFISILEMRYYSVEPVVRGSQETPARSDPYPNATGEDAKKKGHPANLSI